MLYIKAENIKMSFDEKLLFSFERLEIEKGDHIGLVGLNGTGKTTLLNLLYGSYEPVEGAITRYVPIAYYRQFEEEEDANLYVDGKLSSEFRVKDITRREEISGGEGTRVRLAKALSQQAPVVFVDEPTSNLDRKGITLVKEKLSRMETFVVITHERELLEELCNRIIEIKDQTIYCYKGNYSAYKEQSSARTALKQKEYDAYVEERARLMGVYREKKKKASDIGKRPKDISPREARLRNYLASKPYDVKQQAMERQAKAVESRIEHLEVKEKPKEVPKIAIDFTLTNPPENKVVIEGRNLSFSYGSNKIFERVTFRIKNKAKVAIVGDNGTGKTTLLNCIINDEDGIYVVPKARLGFFHQKFEELEEEKTVLWNMMRDCIQSESAARSILARLLLDESFMNKPVSLLSGGEKVKLSLGKLLVSDANVLLLDEPTNYLDLPSVEAVTDLLKEYEGTILFVTHDRALIDVAADELLVAGEKKVTQFLGNLTEYEKSLSKDKAEEEKKLAIEMLEMKMVALISRLSATDGRERDELEKEYGNVLASLKQLKA